MVQYNEAGVSQKCKNSTHRVAMLSEDDDASTIRQSSSCSCLSTSDLLTHRHGASCHGPEAPTERPPLVVDHVLSF